MTGPLPPEQRIAEAEGPATTIDEAIASRRSVRAFTTEPVPRAVVEELLQLAACAPSGTNTQPWRVYVLQGASRDALVAQVLAAHTALQTDAALAEELQEAFSYYPAEWRSPYLDRRRQNGWALYGLLGIERGQHERMHAQQARNFSFFDAPVGLIFTVDRFMGQGALMDCAMFMQNLMLAARARGLHTCPQAAWNRFGSIVLPFVDASNTEMLACGMALGHEDRNAVVNRLRTPREPVAQFARWVD